MKKQILLFFFVIICGFFFKNVFIKKHFVKNVSECAFEVYRFEQDFFNMEVDSFKTVFPLLKKKYPTFFTDTTINFKEEVLLNDTLNSIFDSVQILFKDESLNLSSLRKGYCNYKSYFPRDTFSVYTYLEGTFDYRYPVVYSHQRLYISLDLFLGSEHSFYNNMSDYIRYSQDVQFLPTSCFLTLAGRHIPYPTLDTFLSSIIHYAKAYFFTQKMLLDIPSHILFKCTPEKIQWCEKNEKVIWEYMIENDYLFSTSTDLIDRFVSLAPFSKFGLDIDSESPGSVGVWLGLQIINAYVKKNNVSLVELLNETDYMKILNQSGYKP